MWYSSKGTLLPNQRSFGDDTLIETSSVQGDNVLSTEDGVQPVIRSGKGDGEPANTAYSTHVLLEPLPHLEWSLATEAATPADAASPLSLRRSWIHRAPMEQVLRFYRRLNNAQRDLLPAPWWLKAVDRGGLPSRAAAFEIEDEVHALLTTRPGWVFVPWGDVAEGYWEYSPSDRQPMTMPTTVALTDQHPGWVDVCPAHAETAPLALPMKGVAGLAIALGQIESW